MPGSALGPIHGLHLEFTIWISQERRTIVPSNKKTSECASLQKMEMNSYAKVVLSAVLFCFLTPHCCISKVAAHWTDTKTANILFLGHPKGAVHLESTVHPFTSRIAKDSKPLYTGKNSLLEGS